MSKYLEKSTINYSNFSNQGTKSYAPIISEELKSFIFSNISTNYQILYFFIAQEDHFKVFYQTQSFTFP